MSKPPEDATAVRSGGSSSAPRPPLAGERFAPGQILAGRYRIVSLLGRGGMGEVYRADDLKLGQSVALKHLPARFVSDPIALERLHEEVRVGRQVSHPNVCRLFDIIEADGEQFIAMEHVDGEDLASLLRRIGRLPGDKAMEIARGICAGLAAAHDRGFVHRDLKPANIMIDGRGVARVMDFGLASASSSPEEQPAEIAGTPSYMAPEQLAGRPAGIATDIYSLGLVLYEMFTGRRLFDAATLEAVRSQHGTTKTRPGSIVPDLDPSVERVILRCLEEDPAMRPPSVHAVIASLPGGDPLQAAIAAGETPSPAMVAAAGAVGDLPAGRAWALVGLIVVAVIAGAWVSRIATLPGYVRDLRSRPGLIERAESVARLLAPDARASDREGWYATGSAYLRSLAPEASRHRWRPLADAPPSPVHFRYRQSPAPMIPVRSIGRLNRHEPPLTVPGMVSILLDHQGRLLSFERVPPRIDASAGAPYDWEAVFEEAGLELGGFEPVPPLWTPTVGSDRRYAWSGAYPNRPDIPIRIEAASRGGKPVWFEVIHPWNSPLGSSRGGSAWDVFALIAMLVLLFGVIFAWRNVARGRADVRGAARIAAAAGSLYFVARLSAIHYSGGIGETYSVLVDLLSVAFLYYGGTCGLAYLAVEPYIRRRWPHMLIGLTRAVKGRFRDPLVGSNVLTGIAAGAIALVLTRGGHAVAVAWGAMIPPDPLSGYAINSPFGVGYLVAFNLAWGISSTLSALVLLLVLRLVTRNDAAAFLLTVPIWVLVIGVTFHPATGTLPEYGSAFGAAGIGIWVLRRFGALALAMTTATMRILGYVPLTLSASEPYSPVVLGACAILALIALFAFRTSLGGKPAFGSGLLEDEAPA
ncbi:MAG: serine/threonine-protein kinase [Thermoanaerobaculia bacterium]